MTARAQERAVTLRPAVALLLIAPGAFLAVLGIRVAGGLQALELLAYDACLGWRVRGGASASEVLVVGITDRDVAGGETTVSKDGQHLGGDADHCRILISQATLARLDHSYAVEAVGALNLKGKARPVEVYRVLDRREQFPEPSKKVLT